MKKGLKENKGFSLVELLVALLIMAVIAGTAITLFGGILDTSKGRADTETAENIKRAILTYVNASGDTNLSCLGVAATAVGATEGTTTSEDLLKRLAVQFSIVPGSPDTIVFPTDSPAEAYESFATVATGTKTEGTDANFVVDPTDLKGKYGPFLDVTKDPAPTQSGVDGWDITVNTVTQAITVTARQSTDADKNVVTISN